MVKMGQLFKNKIILSKLLLNQMLKILKNCLNSGFIRQNKLCTSKVL